MPIKYLLVLVSNLNISFKLIPIIFLLYFYFKSLKISFQLHWPSQGSRYMYSSSHLWLRNKIEIAIRSLINQSDHRRNQMSLVLWVHRHTRSNWLISLSYILCNLMHICSLITDLVELILSRDKLRYDRGQKSIQYGIWVRDQCWEKL